MPSLEERIARVRGIEPAEKFTEPVEQQSAPRSESEEKDTVSKPVEWSEQDVDLFGWYDGMFAALCGLFLRSPTENFFYPKRYFILIAAVITPFLPEPSSSPSSRYSPQVREATISQSYDLLCTTYEASRRANKEFCDNPYTVGNRILDEAER